AMPYGGEIFVQGENETLEDKDAKALETAPGRYVRISVADTGIGMSEETQARIFDPFFTTKGLAQGSGLGLSSVYGIVKHHDGIITVDSAVGEGTTFRIYLPASGEEAEAAKAPPRVEPAGGSGTILFVDDEEGLVASGRRGLQRLGFEVLVAASGPEALEVFESNKGRVLLVILGLTMPGMGGGEVFDKLREINPKVKVILSSGYGMEGEPGEIMRRGCDAFVQKPYDLETLAQLVGEVLNRD
ncbi:MAG: ATP-binding protein, partial [bacterium]